MTDRALDDLARRVLLDVCGQEYGDAIEELPEHDFSPAFEKKMKKLIRRADHPIRYRVAQAAACLLLAALLGSTVLAISPEARAAFVGWVREVYETWYIYKYEGAVQQLPKDVVFQPTWIPDGFIEVSPSASEDQICIIYKDDNFNSIMFVYTRNMESANLYIQRDEVDAQTVRIGDLDADLYLDQNIGGANGLVWRTENALFLLYGNCSGDELIKMAESVQAQEVPKPQAVYRPFWLPDGYELVVAPEPRDHMIAIYENQSNDIIVFNCYKNTESMNLLIGQQGTLFQEVYVGDISADLYFDSVDGNINHLIWEDSEGKVVFWISSSLDGEVMVKMAESVQAQEVPEQEVS